MSAYNWVVVPASCPACGITTEIRAQTHVAADYDGDETGRFHDREYRIGDSMRWWTPLDPRFASWRANRGRGGVPSSEIEEEACYAECPSCHARLFVLLRFNSIRIETVVAIGREETWPDGYLR
jgi:hypothetical protein